MSKVLACHSCEQQEVQLSNFWLTHNSLHVRDLCVTPGRSIGRLHARAWSSRTDRGNKQQLIAHYIQKRLDKHPYRDSPSSSWSQWTPWIFWLLFKIPLQQPLFRKCKPFHLSPDGGPTFNKHLFVSTWSIENRFCGMISWNDSGIWDPDLLTTILWCKGDGGFLLGSWATFHLGYICFGLILPSTLWYLGEVIISCTATECLPEYPLAKFLIFWKGLFSLVGPALRGFELCSSLEYLVPSNSEGLFEFPRF